MKRLLFGFGALLLVSGCAGMTTPKVGGGDSGVASGSASQTSSQGTKELHRCAAPIATIALVKSEDQNQQVFMLGQLPPDPLPAMRLIAQQSGCFRIVNRDAALRAAQTERALAGSGQLKAGSRMGGGQIVAADYTILTEVLLSNQNASGANAGAILGSFLPFGAVLGAVAGGVRTQEATVLLTVVDNRTTEQLSTATGKASGTSFSLGGGGVGFGGGVLAGAGAGGYENTDQGKVVIAAMVDALNNVEPLIPAVSTAKASLRRK